MQSPKRTWDLDDFGAGIDLRDGLWSRNQSRLRDLRNCRVTKGRKLRRRPPCVKDDITLDEKCQGLIAVDGVYFTFAKKGDAIVHTGADAARVQTLYFDNPDLCTSWELGRFDVFDGYAAAWIIHTFPSTAYPKLAMFHAWDQLVYAPTFSQDPYIPGLFSPSMADLPDQRYDASFRPALGQGASKLWTSTLRGNTHASRTADARVWNQRTIIGVKEDGEQFCFVVPEGAGITRRFLVPRQASDLDMDARWAYYVLEKAVGSAWVPIAEVSAAPSVNDTWQKVAVASRFAGGWDEIAIDIRWGSPAAGLIRLRLVAGAAGVEITGSKPAVTVKAGAGSSWKLGVAATTWRHRGGDGQAVAAHDTADMASGSTYLLAVTSDAGGFPELVDITGGFPNGWQREHRAFYKRIVNPAAATGATALNPSWGSWTMLAGTVQVFMGVNSIDGVGTNFDPDITINSVVRVNGETRTILARSSDVAAATTSLWASDAGPGASIERLDSQYAVYSGGETHVSVTLAALAVGNNLRINSRDYVIKAVVSPGIYQVTYNGASGDFVSFLNAAYSAYLTNQPTVTDYSYAFESDKDNAWYTNLIAEYTSLAGAEDALSINTAAQDNTGGLVTSISSVRNRMLVTYAGSMQLWSIDQDTNRTSYLDQLQFGTDAQDAPSPVSFYGSIVVPTAAGIRSISVVGANTDNLQDTNLGEPVASLAAIDVRHAIFWPWFGQYIVAGIRGGALVFQVLDYSREAKITAWSLWSIAGMTDVDPGTLIADGSKLRWRSGRSVYHFDAAATVFRDFADVPGLAYESFARLHYNDMGQPGKSKRFTGFDIVQEGTCSIGFDLPPFGSWNEEGGPNMSGPVMMGTTYGRARMPLALTGPAVALVFTSQDESGWELQRVAIDFLTLRR